MEGRSKLTGYKLLFVGDDGHHSRPVRFKCSDDIEATLYAEERRAEHVLQLWAGKRMVAQFPKRQDA
jgi:hypothetical protein